MKEHIILKYPVTLPDGGTLDQLDMRRPTLGDFIAAKINPGQSDVAGESRLAAKLCGVNPEDFALMDLADYMQVSSMLARFLNFEA